MTPVQKEKPVQTSDLIEQAKAVLDCRQITEECVVSEVSAALLKSENNMYVGASISAACDIGPFCSSNCCPNDGRNTGANNGT
jgi:hypothetical protein